MTLYFQLFFVFFKLGLFSFGGGYAVLSLLQHEVIEKYNWLSVEQFTEIVALSQMTPGPISINAATYIGYKVSGNFLGALVPTVAVILPSTIIIMIILLFLNKFKNNKIVDRIFKSLKPIVVGLILAAGLNLLIPENFISWQSYLIFIVSILLSIFFKISTITNIILAGILGIIFNYIF